MKRGSTDVDWVIAIGLFITFLLSILVFLKPGITAPHRPEALLDIVEDGIKQETQIGGPGIYWTIYEVPLYLKEKVTSSGCFKIPFEFEGWKQSDFNLYKITGDINNKPTDPVDPTKQTPIPFKLDGGFIIFKPEFSSVGKKEIFILDYSENLVFSQSSTHDVNCEDPPIYIEETDLSGNPNFKYDYGVIEPIKGISQKIINDLKTQADMNLDSYNDLKISYGFPITKEFSVHLIYPDNTIFDFQPMKPEIDANIFVREWSDFILNDNGLRDPVIVNIRVW